VFVFEKQLRIPIFTYFLKYFYVNTAAAVILGVHRSIADSVRCILRQVRIQCNADDSASNRRAGDRAQLSAGRRRRHRLLHSPAEA